MLYTQILLELDKQAALLKEDITRRYKVKNAIQHGIISGEAYPPGDRYIKAKARFAQRVSDYEMVAAEVDSIFTLIDNIAGEFLGEESSMGKKLLTFYELIDFIVTRHYKQILNDDGNVSNEHIEFLTAKFEDFYLK